MAREALTDHLRCSHLLSQDGNIAPVIIVIFVFVFFFVFVFVFTTSGARTCCLRMAQLPLLSFMDLLR